MTTDIGKTDSRVVTYGKPFFRFMLTKSKKVGSTGAVWRDVLVKAVCVRSTGGSSFMSAVVRKSIIPIGPLSSLVADDLWRVSGVVRKSISPIGSSSFLGV